MVDCKKNEDNSMEFAKTLVEKSGYKISDKLPLDVFIYVVRREALIAERGYMDYLNDSLKFSKLRPLRISGGVEGNSIVITSWKYKPDTWEGSDVHIYPSILETPSGCSTDCGITIYSPHVKLIKIKREPFIG
jgi:hypothetical protein